MELLLKILEGREYRLGDPWMYFDDALGAVIPILKVDWDDVDDRDYVTLPEVKDELEFEDTGAISGVKVKTKGKVDKPVLILAGEILEGAGTQSRGVVHSTILFPEEVKTLETRCVHKSHPISVNAGFRPVGLAPKTVTYQLMSGSQSSVWSMVNSYTSYALSAISAPSTTSRPGPTPRAGAQWRGHYLVSMDSLPKAMKLIEKKVSDVIEKVPCFEGQVGAVIVGLNGVEGIEVFDHPKSWEARYKDIMSKYVETLETKSDMFTINKDACIDKVKEFIRELAKAHRDVITKNGCMVVKIENDRYIGEVVELNGRIIHLFAVRKEVPLNNVTLNTANINVSIGTPTHDVMPTDTVRHTFRTTYRTTVDDGHDRWYEGTSDTISDIFSKRKGWKLVLNTLESNPQGLTWTELYNKTGLNSVTLTRRIKEGKAIGVIKEDLRSNGRKVYKVTSSPDYGW